jgi:hypothetical protein
VGESDNLSSLHVSAFTRQWRLTAIAKIHATAVPGFLSFFSWNTFFFFALLSLDFLKKL